MRETDTATLRPIQYPGNEGARLADEGKIAFQWSEMREARIEVRARHHDAEAIGADQAKKMRLGCLEDPLLERLAAFAQFTESGGDDDRALGAACSQIGNEPGDSLRGCRDDGEIGGRGQGFDIRIDRDSVEA